MLERSVIFAHLCPKNISNEDILGNTKMVIGKKVFEVHFACVEKRSSLEQHWTHEGNMKNQEGIV